ncbi:MAG: lysophospholipid acyltransferase family protein [Oscillospiraceae bacterium]|nr:lysophospholipid acyltransferase family protein [Oscillospiraceae bacterium]
MSFYAFARGVVSLVSKLMYKVRYEGVEQVPEKGFVLCSNHISQFDPIFVAVKLKPQCFFMAKEELFRFKPLALLLRALGAFPVARGKGDTGAIEKAVNLVKSGNVVAIFPEGHRSKTGELQKLKSGAVLIAAETGCGLQPCVIKKGKRKFIRRPVVVRYGAFITPEQLAIQSRAPSEIRAANRLLTGTLQNLLEEAHV